MTPEERRAATAAAAGSLAHLGPGVERFLAEKRADVEREERSWQPESVTVEPTAEGRVRLTLQLSGERGRLESARTMSVEDALWLGRTLVRAARLAEAGKGGG